MAPKLYTVFFWSIHFHCWSNKEQVWTILDTERLKFTGFNQGLEKSDKIGSLIFKVSNLWISLSKRQNRIWVNQFDDPNRTSNERNCNFFVNITLPLIPSIYILDSDLILSGLYRFSPIPTNSTGFWTVLSKIYRFLPDDTLLFLFSLFQRTLQTIYNLYMIYNIISKASRSGLPYVKDRFFYFRFYI